MFAIENACTLNNDGAVLLALGDNSGAIKLFHGALATFKRAASALADIPSLNKMFGSDKFCCAESIIHGTSYRLDQLQNEALFVFDHPFMLKAEALASEEQLHVGSAVLIFNLALASHEAAKFAAGRERCLQRALSLYQMCIQLVEEFVDFHVDCALLFAVAKNNLAQALFECCDYELSRHHLQQSLETLSKMELCHSALSREDAESLLLNTMVLQPPSVAHAA